MTYDSWFTVAVFSLFFLVPFISAWCDTKIENAKIKIDNRLSKYGLRLKR